MKKYLFSSLLLSCLFVSGCGDSNLEATDAEANSSVGENESSTSNKGVVSQSDIQGLYTDPKKFEDYTYDFIGKVFVTPERDEDGVYLQVFADYLNSDLNTLVIIEDSTFEVSDGDYVEVSSTVKDVFEGENLMGGTVTAPVVLANSIQVVDYITAVAPTIDSIDVNEAIDQYGFNVTLEKIEFAEPHTRVYLSVTNNSEDAISFYSHSVKLIIDGQQFESTYEYEAEYQEVQSDILPGVTSSGILTFDAIDPSTSALQVYAEGYSENWDIDIKPFVFDVVR